MACGVALKRHQDCLDPSANSLGPLHASPKRQRILAHPKRSPSSSHQNSPSTSREINGEITEDLIDAVAYEAKRLIHSSSPRTSNDMQVSLPHHQSRQPPDENSEQTEFVKSFFFQGGLTGAADDDRPVFNMKQVVWICAKILKQREDHIRSEYDKVLESKLQEQYETFIRWTQDELHRKFREGTPSYVS